MMGGKESDTVLFSQLSCSYALHVRAVGELISNISKFQQSRVHHVLKVAVTQDEVDASY